MAGPFDKRKNVPGVSTLTETDKGYTEPNIHSACTHTHRHAYTHFMHKHTYRDILGKAFTEAVIITH